MHHTINPRSAHSAGLRETIFQQLINYICPIPSFVSIGEVMFDVTEVANLFHYHLDSNCANE